MSNGVFHRTRADIRSEAVRPTHASILDTESFARLLVIDVPTDLLVLCTWAAMALALSVSLAVGFPLADPLGTLLAL